METNNQDLILFVQFVGMIATFIFAVVILPFAFSRLYTWEKKSNNVFFKSIIVVIAIVWLGAAVSLLWGFIKVVAMLWKI